MKILLLTITVINFCLLFHSSAQIMFQKTFGGSGDEWSSQVSTFKPMTTVGQLYDSGLKNPFLSYHHLKFALPPDSLPNKQVNKTRINDRIFSIDIFEFYLGYGNYIGDKEIYFDYSNSNNSSSNSPPDTVIRNWFIPANLNVLRISYSPEKLGGFGISTMAWEAVPSGFLKLRSWAPIYIYKRFFNSDRGWDYKYLYYICRRKFLGLLKFSS